MEAKTFIKPGEFGLDVAADHRRIEFDFKNQVIVQHQIPVDTVFFGDSITHFWELGAYFKGTDGIIVNRGIGGDQTQYALRRLEADVLQLHPKRCVLLLGINDCWDMEFNDWWQREGMEYEEVVKRAEENLKSIIERVINAGIEMVVCSILPTKMAFTNREELRHDYVLEVNAYLKDLCEKKKIAYVDYYSSMVNEDGRTVRDGLTFEGLHPNVFGYDIMAEKLKELVNI